MNQSKIKQLLTLSNSSISLFTQTLSQSDKVKMLRTSERCAVHNGHTLPVYMGIKVVQVF